MKPKYELLRETYAIIGGIPVKAFDLKSVIEKKGKSLSCGTVACAIGWLGLHPKFRALGLKADRVEGVCEINFKGKFHYYEEAASKLFGISEDVAKDLFEPRKYGDPHNTDKELCLERIHNYLESKGQLTAQLAAKKSK